MEMISENSTLFTIGHSGHQMSAFTALLNQHRIDIVADVRSQPYSKFHPQFNRETLAEALIPAGVKYLFMGRSLGARREEPESYRINEYGKQARYDLICKLATFREGLDSLRRGLRSHRIALMCAEKDPLTCHRSILICHQLRSDSIDIQHILEDGSLETTSQAERRLLNLLKLHPSLFQDHAELIEQAYVMQAEKIAYTEPFAVPKMSEGAA